jgi:hypothetical protein
LAAGFGDIILVNQDASALGLFQTIKALHQSGFTTAVRTKQDNALTTFNGQVKRPQNVQTAVVFIEILNRD